MILVYDGSFEGFLTLIYEIYYRKLKPSEILRQRPKRLILEELIFIQNDEEKASKVLNAIKQRFSKSAFELILNTFMCDSKEFEIYLIKYIILGFKDKSELNNINKEEVFYLQNLQKELFSHVHKMYGFVRFEELEDETLYAKIDTKFNIVYFLGKHFLKRLNNQIFIIHDINRKIAFIKNKDFLGVQNISSFEEPKLNKKEEKFKKLWTTFFKAVSIENRKNKKCQQNFVPLLYRTYMTEFL